MTKKQFYLWSYGGMGLIIIPALVVGYCFPAIPGIVYALSGLAAGIALIAVLRLSLKKSTLILSDERTKGNRDYAAAFTFHVLLYANSAAIIALGCLPNPSGSRRIVIGTLCVFLLAQMAVFYAVFAIRSRKH